MQLMLCEGLLGPAMPQVSDWSFVNGRQWSSPSHPSPNSTPSSSYLDHVDDRIRRYVSAKEKLIALLEEERQAVIHRAVTRGLDPNVRLKPSGVEWLGDVPAHWEVAAASQTWHSKSRKWHYPSCISAICV